uniref:hypothetical protein n=1 Tax=Stenotrophomonas geniculata TaxID=86188 RepID=UPI003BF7C9E5
MTNSTDALKILFIVNPKSGKNDTDWASVIREHFNDQSVQAEILELEKDCDPRVISRKIQEFQPD